MQKDVIVVIKTQCHHGAVSDVYATGRYLVNMGCILAQDMTTECLFAKLSYLLGKVSLTTLIVNFGVNSLNLNLGIHSNPYQTSNEDKPSW